MIDKTLLRQYRKNRKGYTPARTALYVARCNIRAHNLGIPAYPENVKLVIDGIKIAVDVQYDQDCSPFDWDCFYGKPENGAPPFGGYWDGHKYRHSGYVRINTHGRDDIYYHRKAAIQRAIFENNYPRCTAYKDAARSVDAEIAWWSGYFNDYRWYIGVSLVATDGKFEHDDSLWGIEADYNGCWRDSLLDMIDYALHSIREQRMDAKRRAREERARRKAARIAVKQRIIDSLNGFLDDSSMLAEGV